MSVRFLTIETHLISEETTVDDYTVVIFGKGGKRRLRITTSDGRAIPQLEELLREFRERGLLLAGAEKIDNKSVGLIIIDIHFKKPWYARIISFLSSARERMKNGFRPCEAEAK